MKNETLKIDYAHLIPFENRFDFKLISINLKTIQNYERKMYWDA